MYRQAFEPGVVQKITQQTGKMRQTKEEILTKKRESERKRYDKIKNNPARYAEYKQKNKQKYQRRKSDGRVTNIYQLAAREQTELRQKWRLDARKSYERKRVERRHSSRLINSSATEQVESPVSRRITRSSLHSENPETSVGTIISDRPSVSSPSPSASSKDNVCEDDAHYREHSGTPISSILSPPLTLSSDSDSFEHLGTSMNVTIRSRDASPSVTWLTSDRSATGTPTVDTPTQQGTKPPSKSTIENEIEVLRSQLRSMFICLVLIFIITIVNNWILIWCNTF